MNKHVVFQVVAAATVALVLWLMPLLADAAPRRCPSGYPIPIANGCRSVAGNGVACNQGYEGRFRSVDGRWVGFCAVHKMARGG